VGFTDLGNFRERVVGTKDGGSGCGVYVEGCFVFEFSFFDELFEFRGDHTALVVNWDGNHVIGAQTTHLSCFFERVVAMSGGEEDELMRCIAGLFGFWKEIVPGDDYGGCV
jgi:hypothetical protein